MSNSSGNPRSPIINPATRLIAKLINGLMTKYLNQSHAAHARRTNGHTSLNNRMSGWMNNAAVVRANVINSMSGSTMFNNGNNNAEMIKFCKKNKIVLTICAPIPINVARIAGIIISNASGMMKPTTMIPKMINCWIMNDPRTGNRYGIILAICPRTM